MNTKYKISFAFLALIILGFGCSKKLEEHPKTAFTTEYFKTPQGIQDAVNAAYSGMRYNYGPTGALGITVVGTDEFTFGDQPRTGTDGDNTQQKELGTYAISSDNGAIQTPWNRNYSHINLCNAIVEFAPDAGLSETAQNVIIAEARYLRAHYYMLLVTQFGAVPLNLGSGDLQFNTVPSTDFFRLPTDQLLIDDFQAMIDDLTFASENLPDQRPTGAAAKFKLSKAAALHMLSKIYLFRAYSVAKQSTDFQSAYNAAMELINNKGKYGVDLLPDYGDVHKPGNDYNIEILYSVERMPLNNQSNEVENAGSDFAEKVNIANNHFNANYQNAVPNNYPNSVIAGKVLIDGRPLQYGRPLRRYAPTEWLWKTAFADKVNDSRYENSFRTVWYAASENAQGTANYDTYVSNLQSYGLSIGDTAIYLAPTEQIADQLKALTGAQKKNYWIIAPSEYYSNQNTAINIYPNLKKYDDPVRAAVNDVSGRPFIVSKFSEVYLLAAEAALGTGNPNEAVNLINVLKKRAAFRPGLSVTEIESRYQAIMVNSASQITLDFILDERTRELAGESMRWPDLAMRGKLVDRVKAHNPDAGNVKNFHQLRPIPRGQMDAISDPDKAKYQNPGY